MKKKVALIFGGRSLEREISIITAMQVLSNVDKSKFDVEPVYMFEGDFYVGGIDEIASFVNFNPSLHKKAFLIKGEFFTLKRDKLCKFFKPDVALLCCHGGEGENGILQSMMEYNNIPYTSSDTLSSAVCMDKGASKRIFESLLLNVLPYEIVSKSEFEGDEDFTIERIESILTYPLIIKPASQGSSIGIGVAKNSEELRFAMQVASQFDDRIVVEHKLSDFKEVNCACITKDGKLVVSQTEQPCSPSDFLTFDDKYGTGGKMSGLSRIMPAQIGSLDLVVKATTERVYREMGLFGVVRIDYLVDETKNKVYINEINTIPGSMAFYLFEGVGIAFSDLITVLCNEAIERHLHGKKRTVYNTDVLSGFVGGTKMRK